MTDLIGQLHALLVLTTTKELPCSHCMREMGYRKARLERVLFPVEERLLLEIAD
jgi:hypothetical protein